MPPGGRRGSTVVLGFLVVLVPLSLVLELPLLSVGEGLSLLLVFSSLLLWLLLWLSDPVASLLFSPVWLGLSVWLESPEEAVEGQKLAAWTLEVVVDIVINSHAASALMAIPVFRAGAYAETSDTSITSERKTKANLNDLILTYYRLPE